MKPVLYYENETTFNHNGIAVLNETLTGSVTEKLNGSFELEMEYPVNGRWFNEITKFRIVKALPNTDDDPHLFRIYDVVKSSSGHKVIVKAASITNDLGGNIILEYKRTGVTALQAIQAIKSQSMDPITFDFNTDINTTNNIEWVRRNSLNALIGEEGSFIDVFGGEIKRTNTILHVYNQRGRVNVSRISARRGLKGVKVTENVAGIVTKILPFFTRPVEDSETNETETITGAVVQSQYHGNYPIRRIQAIDFSSYEEVIDYNTLMTKANTYFTTMNPGCDLPTINMEIDLIRMSDSSEYKEFRALESINLADTVTVYSPKYDISTIEKVIEIEFDFLRERVTHLVVGDKKTSYISSLKASIAPSIVNDAKKYTDNALNTWQFTADGKNRIFRGPDTPPSSLSQVNDLWFKTVAGGEVEMYIYDGVFWQPLVTADMNQAVKDAIKENMDIAEAAVSEANNSSLLAQQAREEAQLSRDEAETAREEAELARDKAIANGEAIVLLKQDKADKTQLVILQNQIDLRVKTDDYNTGMTLLQNQIDLRIKTDDYNTGMTLLQNQIDLRIKTDDYNTGMTLLQNQIDLRVTENGVTALILADKTIKDTRTTNQNPNWYRTNYPKLKVREFKTLSVIGLSSAMGTYAVVETEVRWNSSTYGKVIQTAETDGGTYTRTENTGTTWTSWDQQTTKTLMDAAITISKDQIELSVDGKINNFDAIGRINVQAGKVLIRASDNLLMVTPSTTYIQNATIKDAMIDTLNASKLTAGTINASVINVINLNANNITTGTLQAIKLIGPSLEIDLATGYVSFSKGVITSEGMTWDLNTGYMSHSNSDSYLQWTGSFPTLYLKLGTTFTRTSTQGYMGKNGTVSYSLASTLQLTDDDGQRIIIRSSGIQYYTTPISISYSSTDVVTFNGSSIYLHRLRAVPSSVTYKNVVIGSDNKLYTKTA